jgi:hypothetical protein
LLAKIKKSPNPPSFKMNIINATTDQKG